MKYTIELTIGLPRDRVSELFDDPNNLPKWQEGLVSMQFLSGTLGEKGAKTSYVYDQGGRKMELVETILERDMPREFSALFEGPGVRNWNINRFYETDDNQTRWVQENEFKFSGLMTVLSLFMRGAFPKETRKSMNRFKEFAEQA